MRYWFAALLVVIGVSLQGSIVQTQQRAGTPRPTKSSPSTAARIRTASSRIGPAERRRTAVGRFQRRRHRPRWPVVWRSTAPLAGHHRAVSDQGESVDHFDESGKEIRSFGGGMFVWPHGIHVDRDGNVWVNDARAASVEELKTFPGEANKGSVVVKFSPQGKVLMTLGKPGVRGNPPQALTDPTDVVTDPKEWRCVRNREPYRRERSQPGRAHLGVRQKRKVPSE